MAYQDFPGRFLLLVRRGVSPPAALGTPAGRSVPAIHSFLLLEVPVSKRPIGFLPILTALILGAMTVGTVQAQTGTVTGRVTDARTLQPVGSAQVFNNDLGIGVLTREDGRYILADVPIGTHTLQVQRIGYGTVRATIDVAANESVTQDFSISEDALALDAIVVTGTPGGTRQRAVGNSVGRVQAAEIAEVAPVQTMQDLIGSREPGLSFDRSSGNLGTGSQIRIRGISSVSMGAQPLIYVDGVRVDNEGRAGPNIRDGRQVSKLDDFAPEQIESIEIIKGPAAATLYGTEASAGVIQIITKKGSSGTPQFDISLRQGTTWLQNASEKIGTSWGRDTETGQVHSFNIWDTEKAAGRPFFENGHLQSYSLSMRGGTDNIRYYLSADFDDNVGIVDYNWDRGFSARANVTVLPTSTVTLDVSTGYVDGSTSFMQQYTGWGVWEQAQWSNPLGQDRTLRGFLRARPEEISAMEAMRENSRFTTSGTLTWQPMEWMTHRLIAGSDVSHEQNQILIPRHEDGSNHDFGGLSLGQISVENPTVRYLTLDYAVSANWEINSGIRLTSSFGAQYYDRFEEVISSEGRVFPAPAIRSLSGAASTTSTSTQVQNKSVGMYIQEELSYLDRLFLTAAVRGDDNSAFGSNYDAAIYPKISGTWVISEEPFWQWGHIANSLRLRSAWGKAGRQPDTFAGVTLYAPRVGPGGQPAVTPQLLGNPDLGPEVSTELELGFDAAFFDDRLSSQFTYYTQKVRDALVNVPVTWSSGFPGSQSVNLGQISNWGWELMLDARAFEAPSIALDFGAGITSNENRIDDLGGIPETTSMREGWAYPAQAHRIITNANFDSEGRVIDLACDGGTGSRNYEPGGAAVECANAPYVRRGNGLAIPKYEATLNTTLTLFRNLRLYGLIDWKGEHWRGTYDAGCRHTCFWTSEIAVKGHEMDVPWAAPMTAVIDGLAPGTGMAEYYNASATRLREVSASYTLPISIVDRIGASRASVNLAARNLWFLHRAQTEIYGVPIPDPEARNAGSPNTIANSNMPPLASLMLTFRASF